MLNEIKCNIQIIFWSSQPLSTACPSVCDKHPCHCKTFCKCWREKNAASCRHCRGETGTCHLKPLKKAGGVEANVEDKAFDVRLHVGAAYSLFEHGPIGSLQSLLSTAKRVKQPLHQWWQTMIPQKTPWARMAIHSLRVAFPTLVPPLKSMELELCNAASTGKGYWW